MSFIVQIWEQPDGFPKPASAVEACQLVALAAERADRARSNTRLKTFQQQILERFPIADERDWTNLRDPSAMKTDLGVWQDDALRAPLGDAPVLTLDIASSRDVVLGWLAEAGPRAGVNVCDPEGGNAWLADGRVFTANDKGACIRPLARLVECDDRAAWEQLVELVERGNRVALGHLVKMYEEGRFVGRDRAISWGLRAEAAGWRIVDGVAMPREGARPGTDGVLEHDRGVLDDAGRARADALLLRLRERTGLREALLSAAHEFDARHVAALDMIAKGDFAAAAMRLQPLANRGHAPSQRTLGHLWATGRATPDDPRQELDWITAAAHVGDTAALQRLAWLYDEGVLRKRETRDARGVHRLLIKDGETSAVRDASRVELKRLNGPPTGKFWEGRVESELLPLAEQGDVAAMVELARVIEWGRSLDKVWERSTPWWIRAAEAGHPLAQREVARFHEQGRGVPKDEAKATHWYGLSARQGDGHAQVEYARRLGQGKGVARDDAQARQWLEQAAQQRIPSALKFMAKGYATGGLFPKDLLAAQLLIVIHDRIQDWGIEDFHGPDEADPREVRRLLAEIDGGADLLEVLKRRVTTPPPAPPAGGLSLAPVTAPAAPAPAPSLSPAAAPAVATRRRERVIDPEPESLVQPAPSSPIGPMLILVSLGMLAFVVAALRKDATARITAPWLIGSAVAALGAFKMSRENGNPSLVAAMDAAPMFIPFIGSALAARMLYFRWRGK